MNIKIKQLVIQGGMVALKQECDRVCKDMQDEIDNVNLKDDAVGKILLSLAQSGSYISQLKDELNRQEVLMSEVDKEYES